MCIFSEIVQKATFATFLLSWVTTPPNNKVAAVVFKNCELPRRCVQFARKPTAFESAIFHKIYGFLRPDVATIARCHGPL